MTDSLNAVVIGCGSLGKHHARIYAQSENANLLAVVDVDEEARRAAADQWGCQAAASLDEVTEPIHLASVVVPTIDHLTVARRLLEAGVPVLVEKPIAISVEEGEAMVALAAKHDVILQVGHIERFNPAVLELGSRLNQPLFIESHRLGPPAPRVKDVGVVLDLMIHDLDLILSLVKSDIEMIDAVGVPILTPQEDICNARLRFTGGCVANVTVSRVTPERQRKIRFFQSDAYLSLDYLVPELQIFRKSQAPDGSVRIEHEKPKLTEREPLVAEIESFIECVVQKKRPVVSGEDGVRALNIAQQITQQAQSSTQAVWEKIQTTPNPA
ncbi:MAG: Gfo/Idh/MocA family oxidoreductase [Candidatus Hinthialibacter antarcticus]|nr:Gfo/Idh/MocA family oxidoreductase [Candidatus Hinthialibacter antarcticus]